MRDVVKTKVQNFRLSEPQEKRFKQLIGYRGYWTWTEVIVGGLLALERQRETELANPPKLFELLAETPAEVPAIAATPSAELIDQAAAVLSIKTADELADTLATLPKKGAARRTKPDSAAAELVKRDQARKNGSPATSPANASKSKSDTRSAKKGATKQSAHKGKKAKA